MIKSGFRGFQVKSASIVGKRTFADSYSTLQAAIQSILGNTGVQVFTTAVPKSVGTTTSGSTTVVNRWNPIYAPTSGLHLTQSTLANMPSFDSTYRLGKYNGVRAVVDDSLAQGAAMPSSSATHTYIFYGIYNSYAVSNEAFLGPFWTEPLVPSQTLYGSPRLNTYNAAAGNANISLATTVLTTAGGFRTYQAILGSAATTILPKSNFYRVAESRILANRTGSMALYDSNMNTIGASNFATVFPAAAGTLLTSNKTYATFSPSSYTGSAYTNTDWDNEFTGSAFRAMKLSILGNCVDASMFTVIYIPAVITADQSRSIKVLLDKVYGT